MVEVKADIQVNIQILIIFSVELQGGYILQFGLIISQTSQSKTPKFY